MSLSVHLLIFNLLQSNFVREADGHLVSPFLMNSWSKPILVLTLKGVFSKPSGKCIVAPNLLFLSLRLQIVATYLFFDFL